MSRRNPSELEQLILMPWWFSVVLAPIAYIGLRWVLPAFIFRQGILAAFAASSRMLAPIAAGGFLLAALLAAIFGMFRKKVVDSQSGPASIQNLTWQQFEWLVGEAFKRQGYATEESISGGADGGVDLVLRKEGKKTLVQCKHWKVWSVGASVVRELYGVMAAEKADAGIVVTSGKFTRDAHAFARGKPIRMIDGPQLWEIIKGVQLKS
ncbi:MAG TPA: restriction endonuclease [Elusimicrobiota bacterium]|nr:restriction endonuclease [Elusimicrobiota bacterium]